MELIFLIAPILIVAIAAAIIDIHRSRPTPEQQRRNAAHEASVNIIRMTPTNNNSSPFEEMLKDETYQKLQADMTGYTE